MSPYTTVRYDQVQLGDLVNVFEDKWAKVTYRELNCINDQVKLKVGVKAHKTIDTRTTLHGNRAEGIAIKRESDMASKQQKQYEENQAIDTMDEQESENELHEASIASAEDSVAEPAAEDMEYVEHEKLKAKMAERDTVQEFLDWLPVHDVVLARWSDEDGKLFSYQVPYATIIANFLGIDEKKLEAEKQHMLAGLG